MWWDQMFDWPSWITVSVMMLFAFGGLAWLMVLALHEDPWPRVLDPRHRLGTRRETPASLSENRDA